MGLLAIGGIAALALVAGGESRLIPTESAFSLGRMKDACAVAAADVFDTAPDLIVYRNDIEALQQTDHGYTLDGFASGKGPFVCILDDLGRVVTVRPR